jgi:dienelactone hydrolase
VVFFALVVVVAAGAERPGHLIPADLFDYDRGAELTVTTLATVNRGEITVAEVELPGATGEAPHVKAALVRPVGTGPFAAVLWVHWLGEAATTNRTEFLDEAVALAREGVVSLLVDAMWARPLWYQERKFEEDRDASIHQVVELRRALDALLAQPGVDPARCAFVGHDYGAMHGALLAGAETRVRAYVFIAGTSSLVDRAFYAAKPESMERYRAQMRPLELRDHLALNHRSSFLFQYAEVDEYVPLPKALEFLAAVSGPKRLIVYGGASHAMTEVPAIRADRRRWLRQELELAPVTEP